MLAETLRGLGLGELTGAFEHSITWEDDIWRADPLDVEDVHKLARQKFEDLLSQVTSGRQVQSRILLFHGQSGAGKTHLVRALRTRTHLSGKGYFGYAQMTPDVGNYADYFLRRLVNSLEKPYDPVSGGETALMRLANRLVENSGIMHPKALDELREATFDPADLARTVLRLADDVVASPAFLDESLDINIVRAFLYLQRNDPRIDQRVRQFLYGRELNELSRESVAALDPNTGEDRAFELIEGLGRMMHIIDGAALVFCIDQVEDLRLFDDPEARFERAVRDLIQIANRLPTAIIIVSSLGDFYSSARGKITQSFIDRVEKSGPVLLAEARNRDEARQIVEKRMRHVLAKSGVEHDDPQLTEVFGEGFGNELAGLSTRRVLELADKRWREALGEAREDANTIANEVQADSAAAPAGPIGSVDDIVQSFEHFNERFTPEMPTEEADFAALLKFALQQVKDEIDGKLDFDATEVDWIPDLSGVDVVIRHAIGEPTAQRLFICNKTNQGGGLKRQVERIMQSREGRPAVLIRASDFPPNPKSAVAQLIRQVVATGGRRVIVSLPDWERIIVLQEFHAHFGRQPSYRTWLQRTRPLSNLPSINELLRLDILDAGKKRPADAKIDLSRPAAGLPRPLGDGGARFPSKGGLVGAIGSVLGGSLGFSLPGFGGGRPHLTVVSGNNALAIEEDGEEVIDLGAPVMQPTGDQDVTRMLDGDSADDIPLIEEEEVDPDAFDPEAFPIGHAIGDIRKFVDLDKDVLRRHAAVLGGSGSGKTTLALSMIENLLLRGIPVVLIDRKGDLCSYANPDTWRTRDGESNERRGLREQLAQSIDVAVYTPGRTSGRPINITLLPTGIAELPDHEQQLLANVSAAALGEMLHLRHSATHQRQSGILSVALKVLGSKSRSEVRLGDLIHLLEEDDEQLIELTQRMDPSGRARRDLMAQLDSLRHRNAALFEGHGEVDADGIAARPRQFRQARPHPPVGHLHRLPWRQREHPVLGLAVPVGSVAVLAAKSEREAAGGHHVRRGRPLHSGDFEAGHQGAAGEPAEARPLGRHRPDAGDPVAGRPRLPLARPDHLVVHRPRPRGYRA